MSHVPFINLLNKLIQQRGDPPFIYEILIDQTNNNKCLFHVNLQYKNYIIMSSSKDKVKQKVARKLYQTLINPLTPKITDFLNHFWLLLTKRKREYIMTKSCIHNIFGSPLSIYEVKITLSCTGKPIWRVLLQKVPKI